ncbi:4Fe-4S binding protein [Anabaena sp. FACHB-1237]|uniref:4Fe-4S binding protein n=1 Tax=Anabaena sp. FACHB-1237 TaxID=2692769 RepID=UPI001680139C|nr:4Fe-4S binding protein [Anabaena sp. FACHB-1237]MBD2136781.1 4Fe-4S binding protein [Anabaena sp. FACHB-1237]
MDKTSLTSISPWTISPVINLQQQEISEFPSKAGKKLAQRVLETTKDLKPIILQAPPGSGKTFTANFIHRKSGLKNGIFAEIDCSQLPKDDTGKIGIDKLLGNIHQQGIIEEIQEATLLIDNIHLLNEEESDRLKIYLKSQESTTSQVRFILASSKPIIIPGLEVHQLKLFPLSQRKEDIPIFANYFLKKFCQKQNRPPLQLSQVSLRRLLSYEYPNNLSELEIIMERAVLMTPADQTMISEQVLWSVESNKNSFRIDLLNYIPPLRRFFLSNWWLTPFWWLHITIFIPLVILGFIGSPTRDQSLVLNIFWAWWWPLYLLLFPLVGRLWCAVCPFMIMGEWVRNISLWIYPRQLRPWPSKWLNQWGAWCVWGGFFLIYLWEKLWDLPHSAYLSSCLLLLITSGAVILSFIYERRLWCRYLCPIGGMNGMFAKLSMIELRSTEQVCATQCNTFACQKPTPATKVTFAEALPTEGQASNACPLYTVPAKLSNNRDCVLCMECLKSCPNRSVQLNLRFPGADLLENHQGFPAEVALMLLLLGGVFLHNSHRFLSWFGLGDLSVDSQHLLVAVPVAIILLSLPGIVTYLTHHLSRKIDPQMPDYLTVVYAYLPMTLIGNLVYYIPSLITESGRIFPVLAHNLGYHSLNLPSLTWSADVANFIQGVILLCILPLSILLLSKITNRPFFSNLPHLGSLMGFVAVFFAMMIF